MVRKLLLCRRFFLGSALPDILLHRRSSLRIIPSCS
ncbi:unnamed protein product [Linum tenue]|uniref:Uncharacterized protein n=1 Tax=Linum tenue TaxID=586396 RepID=A0AAV0KL43_9ROSI|nr:unnamed protein product [Linum tenue]